TFWTRWPRRFVIGDDATLIAPASTAEETVLPAGAASAAKFSAMAGVLAPASCPGAELGSSAGACGSGAGSTASSFFFLLNICYSYLSVAITCWLESPAHEPGSECAPEISSPVAFF